MNPGKYLDQNDDETINPSEFLMIEQKDEEDEKTPDAAPPDSPKKSLSPKKQRKKPLWVSSSRPETKDSTRSLISNDKRTNTAASKRYVTCHRAYV